MPLRTALTTLLEIELPIIGAPMGGVAGADLCAAVSRAGGFGMIGAGYGDLDWMQTQLRMLREHRLSTPWGIGLISWSSSPALLDLVIDARPHAVMVSFGDSDWILDRLRQADIPAITQVQTVAAARLARDAGADLIVAQGTEAGGHGGSRATLPLVPAVVDAVTPTPVVAAGGIADGRGLAAALTLGASGALIGTRLYASDEALGHPRIKQRLLSAGGDDTCRTRVFDIVRGLRWPSGYTGRAVRNRFIDRWQENETALARQRSQVAPVFQAAQRAGAADTGIVWGGEGLDLITAIAPAGDIVRQLAHEAEQQLRRAYAQLSQTDA
ncbi:nitronate monooxygenase [Flagellatimonas centrodinii]|uniref:NAD(P)H-dependent flavin oxidoreductase n=1 Tax=Flagellatimonas centrodinii TaxID=2806210 RepID=UPI001FEF7D00|nr:nitronate monooxygenase [Flagellatimonas centrodinii]ULQ45299.1 nitronate monooxygenase [Flagellatimonas centrodinii]